MRKPPPACAPETTSAPSQGSRGAGFPPIRRRALVRSTYIASHSFDLEHCRNSDPRDRSVLHGSVETTGNSYIP